MALAVFPALVDDASAGELHADFPDFAALHVQAASPGELLARAREALTDALRSLEKGGGEWPEASTLAQVRASHPDHPGSVVWVDVPVDDTPVRVTISIGERLLARIDAAAEEHAMTRSGYLAAAARRQIVAGGSPLDHPLGDKLVKEVVAAGRRVHEVLGPESAVGRTLAELDGIALDGLRKMASSMSDAVRVRRGATPTAAEEPGQPASGSDEAPIKPVD